ncbi:MAG: Omp28-related outer membrane protein [Bacteroidota bacterium]
MNKVWIALLGLALAVSCKKNDSWIPYGPGSNGQGGGGTGGGGTGGGSTLVVSRVQNAFAINFSGNWCGPCGANGIPALYNLSTTHGAKFSGIKVGLNDPFTIPEGSTMASQYGVSGIPAYVAGADFLQSSSAWTSAINTIVATVPANVKAGVALRRTKVGDSIYVDTKAEFFQAVPACNYSLSVFLVENNIALSQAGQSDPNFKHKMVFRGGATAIPSTAVTGVWGEQLESNNTAIPQGKTYEIKFGYVAPSVTPSVNLNNVQAIAGICETDNSGKPLRVLYSNRI